jgi:hypothetical protein
MNDSHAQNDKVLEELLSIGILSPQLQFLISAAH